ncbi:trypsin-like serine protease [Nonomuraea sp. NPDC026600]|uniref:trypsin-like serine protease n=1 Tax=Nonomuraea sp. NPDC026600 TaxID=3155363 RepID=UPI003404473C
MHGSADGSGHPEVGALLADKPHSDGTWSYCTGTLISPTVFLTAAHCGERGQKTAQVSFASQYQRGAKTYIGRYVPDARFKDSSELHDMAVVIFKTAIPGIEPASLPTAGMLSRLKAENKLKTAQFTPVGYGAVGRKERHFDYSDVRQQTSISFEALSRKWLDLSVNRSKGDGSTCFGDSGGPNFLGGPTSHLLIATTVSGADDACKATNFDYRLDTVTARQFLAKFVTLP